MPLSTRFLVAIAAIALALPAFADVRIHQKANGLPGQKQSETRRQVVLIKDRLIRFDEVDSPLYSIVRLDEEVFYEIDPEFKEFRTQSFDYFRKLEREKREKDANAIEDLKARKDRFPPGVYDEILKGIGLREDGKILARVERTGEKKKFDVGGTPVEAEHILVTRNGLVVYDVWVTDAYPRPEALMQLYENLGAFPKEVVEATKTIKGHPISMKVTIDLGTLKSDVALRVNEVEPEVSIPAERFAIPEDFTEVGELTRNAKKSEVHMCALPGCDKVVDEPLESPWFKDPLSGKTLYFCSGDHMKAYIARIKKPK